MRYYQRLQRARELRRSASSSSADRSTGLEPQMLMLSGTSTASNLGYTPLSSFVGLSLSEATTKPVGFHKRGQTTCYWVLSDAVRWLTGIEWCDTWTIQQRAKPLMERMLQVRHNWSRR